MPKLNWKLANLGFVGKNPLDFETNEGKLDEWATVLNLEVPQHLIYKFLAGTGYQLRLPTAEQDQGVDLSGTDTYPFSLANSIVDIPDADRDYQVQAFVDGTERSVTAIDGANNQVDIDTSSDTGTSQDVTVFYLPTDLGQNIRFKVQSTQSDKQVFHRYDLGLLHQAYQKDNEVKDQIQSGQRAPRYFKIQVLVNSPIPYYTSTDQSSDFNQSVEADRIREMTLRVQLMDFGQYAAGIGKSKAEIKNAIITGMSNN